MRKTGIIATLLASAVLSTAAVAQTATTPSPTAPAATATAPASTGTQWRASKLVGVDVYNEQNEKLGDISEILLDQTGKVAGVVIGAGGFLGMGQHDILVTMDKLKFVNEPIRTTSATSPTAPPMTTTTGSAANTRAATEKWYPDHAVLSATKEQVKAMPQFKYE